MHGKRVREPASQLQRDMTRGDAQCAGYLKIRRGFGADLGAERAQDGAGVFVFGLGGGEMRGGAEVDGVGDAGVDFEAE